MSKWLALPLMGWMAVATCPALATPSTAVEREHAWLAWSLNVDEIWRRWRMDELDETTLPGFKADMDRIPRALMEAGVLPEGDDHAWTVGCSAFSESLFTALDQAVSPVVLEQWVQWRGVYRVMCGPLEDERSHLKAALSRMAPLLPPSPSSISWEGLLLDEVPSSTWECMADHVPVAFKEGLDRHEGLKLVARECGVDPGVVFGQAQRCEGCVSHPRRPKQLLFQTWALGPVPVAPQGPLPPRS